jgi:3-ketosteroid 9alpha-monooxygenase subunit A
VTSITSNMMRPRGWFQIGWSRDFLIRGVHARHYFGEEVVVYRGDDGNLRVLDAYCQHMGAHLGHGGTICGDQITCPFHGWEWNGEGENVRIPYEDRPNRGRRIRSWPVVEREGVVYVWHDPNGAKPSWQMPDMFEALGEDVARRQYHDPDPDGVVRCGILKLNPYVVLDNVGDIAHFRSVHGTRDVPTVLNHRADGHRFLLRLGFGQSWKPGAAVAQRSGDVLDIVQLGVGVSYSVLGGARLPYIVIVLATTPVDEHSSEMFQTVWLERAPDDDDPGRLERRMHYACHQLPRDIEVWEHQRYIHRPAWSPSEVRPFRAIRKWAEAFYEPAEGVLPP